MGGIVLVKIYNIKKVDFRVFKVFEGQNDFFCEKTPRLGKRGIQGLFISKNRKCQFSAVFEL